jgi:hypothetical protein
MSGPPVTVGIDPVSVSRIPSSTSACGATTVRERSPDASEPEPTRRDPGDERVALHADPLASE